MSARFLLCRQAGALTTVQDRGRVGWQRFGITPAGAMDPPALLAANLLVGNDPDAAACELTLSGGRWQVEGGAVQLAVTGAAFALEIDGVAVARWRSFRLEPGQELRIGPARAGLRGYLAAGGGIVTPKVLGSRASHLRSRLGTPAIQSGDRLPLGMALGMEAVWRGDCVLDPQCLGSAVGPLRVVLGPQDDLFTATAIDHLLNGEYSVSAESDRMGCRLTGPALPHRSSPDIISDGIVAGAIQVPGTQQPIVLLADRQSTGGYPKIACVIGPDLPRLAQMRPGARLRFTAISATEAIRLARAQAQRLQTLAHQIEPWHDQPDFSPERLLGLNLIDGVTAE